MRCYKVSVNYTVESDHPDGADETRTKVAYAATQADVRSTRQSFVDDHGVKKKDVSVDQVDIPMDKSGLLAFINNLIGRSS